jgi:DASH complex subunit ASK1
VYASTSTSTFSSSGEDSVHNTAHPSAAFLLASRQRGRHDYDDDDELDHDDGFDDSLDADADADADIAPVHPFARARASAHGEYEDDSFDSLDGEEDHGGDIPEETVFGLRPAEREEAAQLQPRLRMYGEDLLQDTMGIGTRLARAGRIEESPTPWGSGGSGGRGV